MSTNVKPIFLKVSSDANGMNAYPIGGQKIKSKKTGEEIELQSSIPVVLRTASQLVKGHILATNEVSPRPNQNHYVGGSATYQVGSINGSLDITGIKDATQVEYIQAYNAFLNGGSSLAEPIPGKPAPRRIPLLEMLHKQKNLKPPTIKDDGFYVDADTWYYLLRGLNRRKNILLVGATGTGKTELTTLVCQKVLKPQSIFDMAISNPMTTLCGNHRINSNGVSEFQMARFALQVQKDNLIVLDELSRAHPASNNILLPLLDSRRTLYIENAMEEAEIKASPDAVFWATANIGMEYVGTTTLDNALMDRFHPVELLYPPADKEIEILTVRTQITKGDAITLVDFANNIRGNRDLSQGVSTRQLLEVSELVYDGFNKAEAARRVILNRFEGNITDGGEKATVLAIIQSL